MDSPSTFGHWLRQRRRSLDLTQAELAERIPCAKGTIRRLESDDLRPSKHLAERLAEVLEVPEAHRPDFIHFARQGVRTTSEDAHDPGQDALLDPRLDPTDAPPEPSAEHAATPASLPAATTRRYHLPAATTSIIGRAHTSAVAIELLLLPDVRLVTLLGPPGVGKTRLSLHIAGQIQPHFRHGACFVALAAFAEADLVLPAIAQAIDLVDTGRPLAAALHERLQSEELLLVLDNFEHLIAAAPLIANLLAAAPTLKVLCTSRVPLQISGEYEFIVPLLALPDLAHLPSLAALAANPSVALFVARARALLPSFTLTAETMRHVAEICHRLEGLPLAIELAATRIKLFTPAAILARLEQRLPFLTGGRRDAPARQRTLTAAIAWSYDLLDRPEKIALSRLGIFWGGCTLEAAEAVCGDARLASAAIVDALAVLVNHSLVQASHTQAGPQEGPQEDTRKNTGEGEVRFSLLEIIREFALQQLDDSGERTAVQERHARYYLAFAAAARERLAGARQVEWMQRVNAESANLRAAFEWSLSPQGEIELGLAAAAGMWWFWWINGQMGEGRRWVQEVLQRAQAANSITGNITGSQAYGRALLGAGYLAYFSGATPAAFAYFTEAASVSAAGGDRLAYGSAHFMIAALEAVSHPETAGDATRPESTIAQMDQALAILGEAGPQARAELGVLSLARSLLARHFGDLEGAQRHADAGLAIHRALGQPYGIGLAYNYQGDVARLRGDHRLAQAHYEAALPLLRQINARSEIPAVLHNLAHAILAQGDALHARALFREGFHLHLEVGNRTGMAECLIGLAAVALTQHQAYLAATLLGATAALLSTLPHPLVGGEQAFYLRLAAEVEAALGTPHWQAAHQAGRALTPAELIATAQAL